MATAAWVSLAIVALLWILLLRVTVRFFGKGADNGWDNALGYAVATVLLVLGAQWAFGTGSWLLIAVLPLLAWAGQTFSLKAIYEVSIARAWILGVIHTVVTSVVVTSLALTAGAVAAYILYGKIIADPKYLLWLILRLIGLA